VTPLRRPAALLATSVLAVGLGAAAAPGPAHAAQAPALRPTFTYAGATVLACKSFVAGGERVRLSMRLDNRRNRPAEERRATASITRRGEKVGRLAVPLTRGGRLSAIETTTFPAGRRTQVSISVTGPQAGGGTTVALARVRAC
jgi:hypothetical protein